MTTRLSRTELSCPVCLKRLTNRKAFQELGKPESCDHFFCFTCILEWSKNVNTCPVDRLKFNKIDVYTSFGRSPFSSSPVRQVEVRDISLPIESSQDVTYCEICSRCTREDRLLLCDGCDKGFHLDCLVPPLGEVPEGDWYCVSCNQIVQSQYNTSASSTEDDPEYAPAIESFQLDLSSDVDITGSGSSSELAMTLDSEPESDSWKESESDCYEVLSDLSLDSTSADSYINIMDDGPDALHTSSPKDSLSNPPSPNHASAGPNRLHTSNPPSHEAPSHGPNGLHTSSKSSNPLSNKAPSRASVPRRPVARRPVARRPVATQKVEVIKIGDSDSEDLTDGARRPGKHNSDSDSEVLTQRVRRQRIHNGDLSSLSSSDESVINVPRSFSENRKRRSIKSESETEENKGLTNGSRGKVPFPHRVLPAGSLDVLQLPKDNSGSSSGIVHAFLDSDDCHSSSDMNETLVPNHSQPAVSEGCPTPLGVTNGYKQTHAAAQSTGGGNPSRDAAALPTGGGNHNRDVGDKVQKKRPKRRRKRKRKRAVSSRKKDSLTAKRRKLQSRRNHRRVVLKISPFSIPGTAKSRARTAATHTSRLNAMTAAVRESYRHDNKLEGLEWARAVLAKSVTTPKRSLSFQNFPTPSSGYVSRTNFTPQPEELLVGNRMYGFTPSRVRASIRRTPPMSCGPLIRRTPPLSNRFPLDLPSSSNTLSSPDRNGPAKEKSRFLETKLESCVRKRSLSQFLPLDPPSSSNTVSSPDRKECQLSVKEKRSLEIKRKSSTRSRFLSQFDSTSSSDREGSQLEKRSLEIKRRLCKRTRSLSQVLITPVKVQGAMSPSVRENTVNSSEEGSSDLLGKMCHSLDVLEDKNSVIEKDGTIIPSGNSDSIRDSQKHDEVDDIPAKLGAIPDPPSAIGTDVGMPKYGRPSRRSTGNHTRSLFQVMRADPLTDSYQGHKSSHSGAEDSQGSLSHEPKELHNATKLRKVLPSKPMPSATAGGNGTNTDLNSRTTRSNSHSTPQFSDSRAARSKERLCANNSNSQTPAGNLRKSSESSCRSRKPPAEPEQVNLNNNNSVSQIGSLGSKTGAEPKPLIREALDVYFDKGEITNRQYKRILERASRKVQDGLDRCSYMNKNRVFKLVADYVDAYRYHHETES